VLKADWCDGSYDGNEGQRVYARDGRALADALERALDAITEHQPKKRKRAAQSTDYLEAAMLGGRRPKRGKVVKKPFTASEIAAIRKFVEFCREGSFRIY
jgi:hypothetical protein